MELLDKLEESINTLTSEVQSLRVENKMLKSQESSKDPDKAFALSTSQASNEECAKLLLENQEVKEKALLRVNKLLDTIQVRLAQNN